jgi:predicted ribosome quality control (RQC) complex YloA/Tae2 family protein
LKKLFPLLNSLLIRELCHRAELNDQQLAAELNGADHRRLHRASLELVDQLEGMPAPRIYDRKLLPAVFSVVPLAHLAGEREESFDSLHDAIKIFLGTSRKEESLLHEKQRLVHFLEQALARAERTLKKIAAENEVLARAAQYELSGKLLMANLDRVDPRRKEIDLENVFLPTRAVVTIPLEPGLSPAKNAERYFDKAKKARASIEEKSKHREQTEQTWEELQELLRRASCVQTTEQLSDLMAENGDRLTTLGYSPRPRATGQQQESVPFRTFVVAGGFVVWVGKSSENNDLLTTKYARPDDLWFHARGSSGSHVVLRVGTGKGEPSRKALDEAASIAAHYSKMKNAKHVPVAMTRRKYVRKRKGAPPGTVTIERERLLFVEPGLPDPEQ